jgi:hypothetical protein
MSFNKTQIIVQGQTIDIEIGEGTETHIGDISKDMAQVGSQIAWWGRVKAAAIQELEAADAVYRNWRAQAALEALKNDPKLSEWKVKLVIESLKKFLEIKTAISKATENVAACDGMMQAFLKKANVLQSTGANIRAEIDNDSLTTPVEPKEARKGAEDDEDDIAESWGQSKKKGKKSTPPPAPSADEEEEDEDVPTGANKPAAVKAEASKKSEKTSAKAEINDAAARMRAAKNKKSEKKAGE